MNPRLLVIAALLISANASAVMPDKKEKPTMRPQDVGSRRVLVLFEEAQASKGFGEKLPADLRKLMRVVAVQDELVILEFVEVPSDAALAAIAKVKGVSAVQRDETVKPQENCASCDRSAESRMPMGEKAQDQLMLLLTRAEAKPKVFKCPLTEHCPDGKAKYWAQDAVDAEAMKNYIKAIAPANESPVQVAVVDSGFDRAQEPSFASAGGVRSFKGVQRGESDPIFTGLKIGEGLFDKDKTKEIIGDPNKDEAGHGTMVASTIAGKGRLGVAENVSLSVYRVTGEGSAGSTSSSFLWLAMQRACRENKDPSGVTVINLSWGGRTDESGQERDEDKPVTKKMLQKMAKDGCLIVKAAGNDNFRNDQKQNLDDNYLRVAATDMSQNLSSFSSKGELTAPGSSVYVLESKTAKDKAGKDKRCSSKEGDGSDSPRRFVNGTSFAAPITAGIASQVVRVLKRSSQFAAAAPADRIKVVNRILAASQFGGTINGLRAVAIADRWTRNPNVSATPAQLLELLENQPDVRCAKDEPKGCHVGMPCEKLKACYQEGRATAVLCPKVNPAFLAGLGEIAADNGAIEDAIRFEAAVKRSRPSTVVQDRIARALLARTEYKRGATEKYDRYFSQRALGDIDANLLNSSVLPYLNNSVEAKKPDIALIKDLWESAILNYFSQVSGTLEQGVDSKTGEDRGSRSMEKTIQDLYGITVKAMGEKPAREMIGKLLDKEREYLKKNASADYSGSQPVVAARIVDSLIRSTEGKSPESNKFFKAEERKLLEVMMKRSDVFASETATFTFFGETYPQRECFRGMVERNWDIVAKAARERNLASLAPVQLSFYEERLSREGKSKETLFEYSLSSVESILAGRSFGTNDEKLIVDYLKKIDEQWPNLSKKQREDVRRRINDAINQAVNYKALNELVTEHANKALSWEILKPSWDSKAFVWLNRNVLDRNAPDYYDPGVVINAVRRLLALAASLPPKESPTNVATIDIYYSDLLAHDKSKGWEMTVPVNLSPNVKNPADWKKTQKVYYPGDEAVMEAIIVNELKNSQKSPKDQFSSYLTYLTPLILNPGDCVWSESEIDSKEARLKNLNPNGQWKREAEALLAQFEKDPKAFGSYNSLIPVKLKCVLEGVRLVQSRKPKPWYKF